jgi:hypothetical protein
LKKLHIAALVATLVVAAGIAPSYAASGTGTSATSGTKVADATMHPMNFGNPPSGEVPILFNDHHVYANPDTLRQGRVLAALVKGGTILVPLASMFEQMGGTASYDAASKSVTAKKDGAEVQVTLGKNEVIINGESRPLDVPPMMYKGNLLVPVRVISEALGAYVEWVPSQHVCVVRYLPPTPVPTPAASVAPTPVPTPSPTPLATVKPVQGFLQGGVTSGKVANEFAANERDSTGPSNSSNGLNGSYVAAGGYFFDPFLVKVDWRQDSYPTTNNASFNGGPGTQVNTVDGGSVIVPQFHAKQSTLDGRLEFKVANPNLYVGVGYIQASNNYGDPSLRGIGVGAEKIPDFNSTWDYYGSVFYYPNANGTLTELTANSFNARAFKMEYNIVKYDAGVDVNLGASPFYLYAGFSGDRYDAKQFAPISQTHAGPYIGLGIHF